MSKSIETMSVGPRHEREGLIGAGKREVTPLAFRAPTVQVRHGLWSHELWLTLGVCDLGQPWLIIPTGLRPLESGLVKESAHGQVKCRGHC
jgi:hypothetical protein